jgi:hypothetical protein
LTRSAIKVMAIISFLKVMNTQIFKLSMGAAYPLKKRRTARLVPGVKDIPPAFLLMKSDPHSVKVPVLKPGMVGSIISPDTD